MDDRLAAEIKSFRANKALSQEALARLIGATTGSVRNWERGVRPLAIYRERLVALLGGETSGNGGETKKEGL